VSRALIQGKIQQQTFFGTFHSQLNSRMKEVTAMYPFTSSQNRSTNARLLLVICTLLFLSTLLVAADDPSPVAYVYLGSYLGTWPGTEIINGFAVAADGSIQLVPNSPFYGPSQSLVSNPSYVFGSDGKNIATYSLQSDGSLT